MECKKQKEKKIRSLRKELKYYKRVSTDLKIYGAKILKEKTEKKIISLNKEINNIKETI